ncbi:DUF5700 domain-containing putative Zn-dependent protease [Clostridium sp.]|uniref:DUF5700 domain-containing putative Zn-dependent protease n=1 Tax=Clostridium sp. TaxID=1506 RepID=UPI002FC85F8B
MCEKIGEVILDISGYDSFAELCQKKSVSNSDVERLLSINSYTKAIDLMGANWGLPHKKHWIEYFSKGFQCDDDTVNSVLLSSIQLQGADHLKKARSNIVELNKVQHRIQKAIESREFIKIASKYIPNDVFEDSIEVIVLVFAPNAGGNKSIIIDVPFLLQYSEDEISRILAHELHHILRSKVEKEYLWKEEYEGIGQALFWFESEGTADLCNFQETAKIYSDFGYARPGQISETLQNISYYIKETNNLITEILKGRKTSKELVKFLSEDVRFHTIGYFLAKTISNTFGNDVVGKVVGDPIEFLNIYQKACKANKNESQYGFSDEMLELLEAAYIK